MSLLHPWQDPIPWASSPIHWILLLRCLRFFDGFIFAIELRGFQSSVCEEGWWHHEFDCQVRALCKCERHQWPRNSRISKYTWSQNQSTEGVLWNGLIVPSDLPQHPFTCENLWGRWGINRPRRRWKLTNTKYQRRGYQVSSESWNCICSHQEGKTSIMINI